jgi:NDP-sugar pyrophosphorylase family protein
MRREMQAVILAGGLGTRLGDITKAVPKPMVPIAGKPYLEHQIRLLAEQGIRDVVLLVGYLGRQIEDHFGDGAAWKVRIRYSREQTPLGTGGALREAGPLLADAFLLIYGDSYLPIDYAAVLRTLQASDARGAVVAYDNRLGDTSVRNNLALSHNGRV